ncbi:transmembrane protein [Cyclospora cayetanensis]|uniref:Transmembrane protein n=1 Tax=Cyclospora cayetanensis TaxID=88456 RepID=A0A1D3D4R3_9EIME|nr:transmembrane protein [Cyclospora cayetanensis]
MVLHSFVCTLKSLNLSRYPGQLAILPKDGMMQILSLETISDFRRFFPLAILAMCAVISTAFLYAAFRICSLISLMSTAVVLAAEEDLRLDVCESIDCDFYRFVDRLRAAFVPSVDFSIAVIKRAHRRLHSLLKARRALVDPAAQGPFAIIRDVNASLACPRFFLLLFLYFVPWLFTLCCNLAQLLAIYGASGRIAEDSNSAVTEAPGAGGDTVDNVAIGPPPLDMETVSRTWEESVVEDLVEFLEAPRKDFEKANLTTSSDLHDFHTATSIAVAGCPDERDLHQRLLTSDSCGPYPTPHQMALQAPSVPPRSRLRSQCLALEPFTLSPETESCPGGFGGPYYELEDLRVKPFFNSARVRRDSIGKEEERAPTDNRHEWNKSTGREGKAVYREGNEGTGADEDCTTVLGTATTEAEKQPEVELERQEDSVSD